MLTIVILLLFTVIALAWLWLSAKKDIKHERAITQDFANQLADARSALNECAIVADSLEFQITTMPAAALRIRQARRRGLGIQPNPASYDDWWINERSN